MTPTALRRLRAELDLTQAAFAAQIGVQRETVARWESGTRAIPEPVARLATRLHTELRAAAKAQRIRKAMARVEAMKRRRPTRQNGGR